MKKYLILTYFLTHIACAYAQTDSFEVQQTKIMKTYNYLTMANKEETSVWKLKILPTKSNNDNFKIKISYDYVPIVISYEHKILPYLSFQLESKSLFFSTRDRVDSIAQFTNSIDSTHTQSYYHGANISKQMIFNSSIAAEIRCYYNMNRRMHRKHTRNNFSGNYFAFKWSKNVMQTGTDVMDLIENIDNVVPDHNAQPFFDDNLSLFYGIQRRFLTHFFVDMHVGIAYRYGKKQDIPYYDWWSYNTQHVLVRSRNVAERFTEIFNFRIGFAF